MNITNTAKKIHSRYCTYDKNTFLILSSDAKSLLCENSRKSSKYVLIHFKIICENNFDNIDKTLKKNFVFFLKSYLYKNNIISYFSNKEILVFINDVSSTSKVLEIIDALEKSALDYFNNIGIDKYFYINLTFSRKALNFEEIEIFYKNIANGYVNIYDIRSIYIKKKKSSKSMIFSNIKPIVNIEKKDILSDLLNNYFSKDDFFHCILNIVSTSKNIDDSLEGIFKYFKSHLDIEAIYLYIISEDDKYFINKSNFFSENRNIKISSMISSQIIRFLKYHDDNNIWCCNNFKEFPYNLKRYLKYKNIKSICNNLIINNNQIIGFVGFETKKENKVWSEHEISKLIYLGKMISVFIKFNNNNYISDKLNTISKNILENSDVIVYTIDDDFNLTYANEKFRQITTYKGVRKKCHEVLMNNEYPCTFCPIKALEKGTELCCREAQFKNDKGISCHREVYYSAIDKYIKIYVSKNENDPEHKYMLSGFDIDGCKKFANNFKDNNKYTLFKDLEFTLPEFYNALNSATDNHILFFDIKNDYIHLPDKLLYELGYNSNSNCFEKEVIHKHIYNKDLFIFTDTYDKLKSGYINFCDISFRVLSSNNNLVWIKLKASLTYNINYEPSIVLAIATILNKKPVIDYITNLPNKYHLKYVIEENFRSNNNPLALMLLKVDNLSKIAKIFGRNIAELALLNIIDIIKSHKKQNMMIFSFDWNTLALKIDTDDVNECIAFYDELKEIFLNYNIILKKNYRVTFSAGCALFPKDATTYRSLVDSAEHALDYSKQENMHEIVFFNKYILYLKNRKNTLSQIIGDSISYNFGGFDIVYQAHIDVQNEELLGAEALSRFKCDEFGDVSPDEFIPLLEEMGFIQSFGKWVLAHAVRDCHEIQKYKPNFHINVNVSYFQLLEDDFVDFLKETLKTYPLKNGSLYLELTETSIVTNKSDLIKKFKRIQEIGVKIAMDDFGVGYSSLGILKEIPINMLKIDKLFVKGINSNKFDASFIQVISTLCSKANIETCLEGVEKESELNSVKLYSDVSMIQGYYYNKPESFINFVNHFEIF